MKKILFTGLGVLTLLSHTHAQDIRDQMNVQTGKAVLFVPNGNPAEVAEQVKSAITQFAIPTNLNFHPLASPLPARPGSPKEKQVIIKGAPVTDYVCDGSYAEITKIPPAVENAFYFNREALRSCLYAFQGGIKVEMLFIVMRRTESLTSGIFNGITKIIRGNDGNRIAAQLKENIEAIKNKIPNTLVARIEAPGEAIEEPDKEAAAQLLPSTTDAEIIIQAASATAQPSIQQLAPATIASPYTQANSPKSSSGVDLSVVGARKELTAMGFKFYDQDQFVDAARRNDFLTVRLFLAAAGIRPSAPDSKGQTALSFADANPEMKLLLTIFAQAEKEGEYPGKITEAIFSK